MVSIKSLSILLLAAVAAAVPLAHEDANHDVNDFNLKEAGEYCASQKQELYCCDAYEENLSSGVGAGLFDGLVAQCNNILADVWAVDVVPGQSACNGEAACCTSRNEQVGVGNVALKCLAFSGGK